MTAFALAIWKFAKPFLPQIGIALAIIGAVWWIHHAGYKAAERDAAAREARENALAIQQAQKLTNALSGALSASDAALGKKLDDLAAKRDVSTQTIIKEIGNDPRYRDPACTVSNGVWAALMQAVGSTGTAGSDGSATIALPGPVDAR